jgi:hypothetical protein
MRCREARASLNEAGGPRRSELHAHLLACPACAAEARFERELARSLSVLKEPAPFSVDVSDRVLARIGTIPVRSRERVFHRRLASAAVLAVAVLLPAAVALLGARPTPREGILLAKGLTETVLRLLAPLRPLFDAFMKVVGVAGELCLRSIAVLSKAGPLAHVASVLCLAAMAAVTIVVLGRDLWQGGSLAQRSSE